MQDLLSGRSLTPAQQCADTGQQFLEVEIRLDDVIVRPAVQALYFVAQRAARCQYQDRHVAGGSQPPAHLEPIQRTGQHQVEHH